MRTILKMLLRCRRGATAVEYGLIVALIFMTMIASFRLIADQTVGIWSNLNSAVTNAR